MTAFQASSWLERRPGSVWVEGCGQMRHLSVPVSIVPRASVFTANLHTHCHLHNSFLIMLNCLIFPLSLPRSNLLPVPLPLPAVVCPSLPDPANGRVSLSGTTAGSTATYSCDRGFGLVGFSTRICQASGEWSGEEPTCERKYITAET